jgi:hypothetical protein
MSLGKFEDSTFYMSRRGMWTSLPFIHHSAVIPCSPFSPFVSLPFEKRDVREEYNYDWLKWTVARFEMKIPDGSPENPLACKIESSVK